MLFIIIGDINCEQIKDNIIVIIVVITTGRQNKVLNQNFNNRNSPPNVYILFNIV